MLFLGPFNPIINVKLFGPGLLENQIDCKDDVIEKLVNRIEAIEKRLDASQYILVKEESF
jgi:hypothetical protein